MREIIFDMDGVIFDSERAVYNGWQELADKYGFKDLEIPYAKCIGVNSSMTRRIFLEFYGEDFPYDKYCKEQSINYHRRYEHGNLPLKPGVLELLTYLRQENFLIAIASSTRTEVVRNQISAAGLSEYFDVIVGGDQVTESKPNPAIFIRAAEQLQIMENIPQEEMLDYHEVYVIEDSYNGIRAAFNAGMIPIMVPDMLEPNDEICEKAQTVQSDLIEVKKWLNRKLYSAPQEN